MWVHNAVKERVREKYDGKLRCERCEGGTGPWHKHHLHYKSLGRELDALDSIQWLCAECHAYIHKKGPDPVEPSSLRGMERQLRKLLGII